MLKIGPITTPDPNDFSCRYFPEHINDWVPEKDEADVVPPDLKAICDTCPAASWCLSQAIGRGEHGYWAGTTTNERLNIKREQLARREQRALRERIVPRPGLRAA